MSPRAFRQHLSELTAQIAGRTLDSGLDAWLNKEHGAGASTSVLAKLEPAA